MGTEITGARTVIGLKIAPTFNTATTIGTGDQVQVESLTFGENAEELTASPIGSGDVMTSDSQRGATSPTIQINKIEQFYDGSLAAASQFFGAESLMNMGSSGYSHSLHMNEAFNTKWITAAWQGQSVAAGSFEFPSCAVVKYGAKYESPPNYAKETLELVGNKMLTSGQTNTFSTLESATMGDTERVVIQPDDEFLINTQSGGALATPTDRVSVTSVDIQLDKPHTFVRECKGSLGNGEPVASGTPPLTGTVTITLARLADMTWFTAMQAGTEYKAKFTVTGSLIGGAIYKSIVWYFPRLKIISDTQYALNSAGINPVTVTFKVLVSASYPTGMFSNYPVKVVTNTRSTKHDS